MKKVIIQSTFLLLCTCGIFSSIAQKQNSKWISLEMDKSDNIDTSINICFSISNKSKKGKLTNPFYCEVIQSKIIPLSFITKISVSNQDTLIIPLCNISNSSFMEVDTFNVVRFNLTDIDSLVQVENYVCCQQEIPKNTKKQYILELPPKEYSVIKIFLCEIRFKKGKEKYYYHEYILNMDNPHELIYKGTVPR